MSGQAGPGDRVSGGPTDARPLRGLPSVRAVLEHDLLRAWEGRAAASLRTRAAQAAVVCLRERLAGGATAESRERLLHEAATLADARLAALFAPRPRRVVNATGVVLHTNLGRAPLSPSALHRVAALSGYSALEFDLEAGARGDRSDLVADLVREATGAEAALVVNNNAAAVLLVLAALAAGREVVVSRGELVEIGGGFRIPEVMAASGARLREVGTTNRTYLRDYAHASGPETAAFLKVHRSNFTVGGFVHEAGLAELADLARSRGLPALYDLGSGAPGPGGVFRGEPTVADAIAEGASAVMFSGDKLLGGPQCGIIAGERGIVRTCARHPLYRAFRVGKLTIAALAATLQEHLAAGEGVPDVPALRFLARDGRELAEAASSLAALVSARLGPAAEVSTAPGESLVGGGSAPGTELATTVVVVRCAGRSAADVEARLRAGDPAVVARLAGDAIVLDPRALFEGEDVLVADALGRALSP